MTSSCFSTGGSLSAARTRRSCARVVDSIATTSASSSCRPGRRRLVREQILDAAVPVRVAPPPRGVVDTGVHACAGGTRYAEALADETDHRPRPLEPAPPPVAGLGRVAAWRLLADRSAGLPDNRERRFLYRGMALSNGSALRQNRARDTHDLRPRSRSLRSLAAALAARSRPPPDRRPRSTRDERRRVRSGAHR